MKNKVLLLVVAMVAGSSCVIGGGGGRQPAPGDVQFNWSFNGGTCGDYPEIRSVVVTIPGQRLMNSGTFGCLVNNYPGIVLTDFAGGTYTYTVDAIGYGNETLFSTSGSFVVDGSISVNTDLQPIGGGNSAAYLRWFFPPSGGHQNPTCDQAGVTRVSVSIDNGAADVRNCTEGQTSNGYATANLVPGQHSIVLAATDNDGFEYYRFTGFFTTNAGQSTAQDFDLQWSVGTALIGWTFTNGGVTLDCNQAGVGTVLINFQDSSGHNVFGSQWASAPCSMGFTGAAFYLPPDNYRVFVTAQSSNGAVFDSNMNSPPTLSVSAGVFPSSPLPVTLFH